MDYDLKEKRSKCKVVCSKVLFVDIKVEQMDKSHSAQLANFNIIAEMIMRIKQRREINN